MILQELKDWVNSLPEEFMEYSIVNGVVGQLDGQYWYRLDKPITTLTVDEENKEIAFLDDSQEDIKLEDEETDSPD